ncbi:MAG: endonuclease [Taibaiella sp.]|nr:endonuclease [Taibaiella sp.]
MNKIRSSILLCSLFVHTAWTQIPDGYYDSTEGLSSFYLKHQLHRIISRNNISWHYADLPGWYALTDRDSFYEADGTLMDLYSENPDGPDPYNYTYEEFSLISGAGEEGLGWNREHIVAQSFFNGQYPMYSDMHFVVPADARVNQRRSNYPFAEVGSSPAFTSLNGSKVGLSGTPGYTLTVFEPIDEFKGDIARMLMYVAVRYEPMIPYFDTTNSRNPFETRQEVALKQWQTDLLMSWHLADPVSEREVIRNDKVYALQGNRNPFVDHPEWAEAIWGSATDDVAPQKPIYLATVSQGKTFIEIEWAETSESDLMGFEMYLNDSLAGITRNHFFAYTQLDPGTEYELRVRAYDAGYNKSPFSAPLVVTTTAEDTFSSDLYFSRIIEGSGYNKAIELTNNTGHTVDLRNYSISKREINESTGSLYWSGNGYQMSGYLAHGRKAVLVHPYWALDCLELTEATFITAGTPLRFDGKTALRLYRGDTGIDLFGAASDTTAFAVDASVYRKPEFRQPSTSFDESEWEWHELDYCVDLGNAEDSSVSVLPVDPGTKFKLYPNPVKAGERLYISNSGALKVNDIRITDMTGKLVFHHPYDLNGLPYIQLPQLRPGWYILSLDQHHFRIVVSEE